MMRCVDRIGCTRLRVPPFCCPIPKTPGGNNIVRFSRSSRSGEPSCGSMQQRPARRSNCNACLSWGRT